MDSMQRLTAVTNSQSADQVHLKDQLQEQELTSKVDSLTLLEQIWLVSSTMLKVLIATLCLLGLSLVTWVATNSFGVRQARVSTMVSVTVDSYTRLTGVLTQTVQLT
jgi:hypothetical protein